MKDDLLMVSDEAKRMGIQVHELIFMMLKEDEGTRMPTPIHLEDKAHYSYQVSAFQSQSEHIE